MSASLQGLPAFMGSTAPAWATDPEVLYNLASIQNYESLGYFLRGRPFADVFRSGTELRERVMFEETPRMRSYLIGDSQDVEVTSPGANLISYFRFFMTDMTWYEEPLIMNAGANASNGAVKETWKNLWKQLWADNYTDQMNYWERYMWRAPVLADDSPTGQEFLSLPAYNNSWLYGQYGGLLTTVNQQSRATYANHRNKVSTYATFASKTKDNVVEGLEDLAMLIKFKPPPQNMEYFDPESGIDMSGGWISASRIGRRKLGRCYRDSGDVWANKSDPFGNPYFAGAPIVYVAAKDTAALYPSVAPTAFTDGTVTAGGTGTAAAESAAANPGPRFEMWQPRGLKICWSKDRFMHRLTPINDRANPTMWSQFINTFGTSLAPIARIQGQLIPSADVTGT
jgi:hypothetical protein